MKGEIQKEYDVKRNDVKIKSFFFSIVLIAF